MPDIEKIIPALAALVIAGLIAFIGMLALGNADLKSTIARMERDAAVRERDHAQALAKTLAEAKMESERKAQAAKELIDAADKRAQESAARADRSARAAAGLRNEIDRLNSRELPSDPVAAGFAHEARVARELLGSCSSERGGFAKEADRLRDKVTDLQGWIHAVVGGEAK